MLEVRKIPPAPGVTPRELSPTADCPSTGDPPRDAGTAPRETDEPLRETLVPAVLLGMFLLAGRVFGVVTSCNCWALNAELGGLMRFSF